MADIEITLDSCGECCNTGGILYYTNASGDNTWENLSNWMYSDGQNPTEIPWLEYSNNGLGSVPDGSTDEDTLVDATGGAGVNMWQFNGITPASNEVCDISSITNYDSWLWGDSIWTGDNFANSGIAWESYGVIWGPTFTGNNCSNINGAYIYGGTFTGDNFTNANGANFACIYDEGGTLFTGDNFTNANGGTIYGGTFTGSNFTHDFGGVISGGTFTGAGFQNYGAIYGGTFEIDGFVDYTGGGGINYSGISITQGGVPYTGSWEDQDWVDGNWVDSEPSFNPPYGGLGFY
jgi:hypothetical protein